MKPLVKSLFLVVALGVIAGAGWYALKHSQ